MNIKRQQRVEKTKIGRYISKKKKKNEIINIKSKIHFCTPNFIQQHHNHQHYNFLIPHTTISFAISLALSSTFISLATFTQKYTIKQTPAEAALEHKRQQMISPPSILNEIQNSFFSFGKEREWLIICWRHQKKKKVERKSERGRGAKKECVCHTLNFSKIFGCSSTRYYNKHTKGLLQ